jgi:hypothetical protein
MATLKEVLAKIPELTEEVKTKILNEKYDDYKPLEEFNKVYNSLENERREHKATKTILEAFEGITPDEAKEFKVKVTEKIKEEDAKAPSDIAKLISEKMKPVLDQLTALQKENADKQKKIDEASFERSLREVAKGKIDPKAETDLLYRGKAELTKDPKDGKYYTSDGTVLEKWFEETLPKTNWAVKGNGIGAEGNDKKTGSPEGIEAQRARYKEIMATPGDLPGKLQLEAMKLAEAIEKADAQKK